MDLLDLQEAQKVNVMGGPCSKVPVITRRSAARGMSLGIWLCNRSRIFESGVGADFLPCINAHHLGPFDPGRKEQLTGFQSCLNQTEIAISVHVNAHTYLPVRHIDLLSLTLCVVSIPASPPAICSNISIPSSSATFYLAHSFDFSSTISICRGLLTKTFSSLYCSQGDGE